MKHKFIQERKIHLINRECLEKVDVYIHGRHYRGNFCDMIGNLQKKKKVAMKQLLHN